MFSWTIISTTVCLLGGLWYHATRKHISRYGNRLQQAPDRLFVLGHAIKFLKPRHQLFDWFVQCQRQFGFDTLEISVPSLPPGVIISSPENVEFVLKNEHLVSKGNFVKQRTAALFGHGIISANGELWKSQRKVGVKFFTGAKLESLLDDILPTALERMCTELSKYADEGTTVDMQSVFLDYTSFVMGHSAYDMDLDSSHPFNRAFDYASDQTGRRFQNPLYPLTELILGSRFRNALSYVKAFGNKIVTRTKKKRSKLAFESLVNNEDPIFDTLIDALLETFGDQQIVADSALNFLSAGKDTTAQALTWLFYLLMKHPTTIPPLKDEIEALLERKGATLDTLELSITDLSTANTPQLTSALYEGLRMYPPIPIEIQECQQDLTLPDSTYLPQGAIIVWCIWAINRAKEIYGQDADEFKPSRWIGKEGTFQQKSTFEFPVFNGGPRSCLGRRMAEVMAVSALIYIVKSFELQPVEGLDSFNARPENSLTLPMKGGLLCRVRHREPRQISHNLK